MNGLIFGAVDVDDYIFALTKLIRLGDIAFALEAQEDGGNIDGLMGWREYWISTQNAYLENNVESKPGASRQNNPREDPVFQSEKLDISINGENFSLDVFYPMNYAAIWALACHCTASELFILVDRESMKGDADKFFRQTGVLNAVFGNVYFSNKEMYQRGEYFKTIDEFVLGTEFCMFNDLGSDWGYQPVLFVKNEPVFSELSRAFGAKEKTTPFSWEEMFSYRDYKLDMKKLEEERALLEKNREAEG